MHQKNIKKTWARGGGGDGGGRVCQSLRRHYHYYPSSSPALPSNATSYSLPPFLTASAPPPMKSPSSSRCKSNGMASLSYYNSSDSSIITPLRHYFSTLVPASAPVAAAAATTTSSTTLYHSSIVVHPIHTSTAVTTNTTSEKQTVENKKAPPPPTKKSPHSKLLRVCSSKNVNAHFAAIEADLLRLNWIEAMNNLVNDWTSTRSTNNSNNHYTGNNNRYGDFIELERNVQQYVSNNLKDCCWHYHGDDCLAFATSDDDDGASSSSSSSSRGRGKSSSQLPLLPSQSALLRLYLFPYERVITSAVHKAIVPGKMMGGTTSSTSHAGATTRNQDDMMTGGGDGGGGGGGGTSSNNNKTHLLATMSELHQRAQLLSHASQLLDVMSKLLLRNNSNYNIDDIDDNNADATATEHDIFPKSSSVWTNHHTSCSNCHRLIVSGWLILHRQWKEWSRQMLDDPSMSAKDIFNATSIFTTSSTNPTIDDNADGGVHHPQTEVHIWATRWLDFCEYDNQSNDVLVGDDTSSFGTRRGIMKSDQALLHGIVAMFATSISSSSSSSTLEYHHVKNEKHQQEYEVLYHRINNLFPKNDGVL